MCLCRLYGDPGPFLSLLPVHCDDGLNLLHCEHRSISISPKMLFSVFDHSKAKIDAVLFGKELTGKKPL